MTTGTRPGVVKLIEAVFATPEVKRRLGLEPLDREGRPSRKVRGKSAR